MDKDNIHMETTSYPGPPPDYLSAINARPPLQGQGQFQQAPAPYQAPGFQINNSASCHWYIGAPNSDFHIFDNQEEVIVERIVDMMQAVFSTNSGQLKRQFRVINKNNQQLLFLEEDESLLSNYEQRAYNFTAKNSYGETVFAVSRDTQRCPCCFCCVQCKACRSEAKIIDSKSQCIGNLVQRIHCNAARFALEDSQSWEVMRVAGGHAFCTPSCVYQLEMKYIHSRGSIVKQGSPWGGALNKYIVKFPPNIDGKLKACCIGTVVLLDFRFHLLQRRRSND